MPPNSPNPRLLLQIQNQQLCHRSQSVSSHFTGSRPSVSFVLFGNVNIGRGKRRGKNDSRPLSLLWISEASESVNGCDFQLR